MSSNNRNQTGEDPNELSLESLQQVLYRSACPSPDLLQEFYWKQVMEEKAAQLRSHLQLCPHCRQEFAAIQRFVEQDETVQVNETKHFPLFDQLAASLEQVQSNAAEWLADLVEGSQLVVARMMPGMLPAEGGLLALRAGEPKGRKLLTYEIEGGEISLIVQQDATQRLMVNVQLLSETLDEVEGHFHLSAKHPNRRPTTGIIDEFGTFTIPNLPPDLYQLVLSGEGYTILVPDLDLRLED